MPWPWGDWPGALGRRPGSRAGWRSQSVRRSAWPPGVRRWPCPGRPNRYAMDRPSKRPNFANLGFTVRIRNRTNAMSAPTMILLSRCAARVGGRCGSQPPQRAAAYLERTSRRDAEAPRHACSDAGMAPLPRWDRHLGEGDRTGSGCNLPDTRLRHPAATILGRSRRAVAHPLSLDQGVSLALSSISLRGSTASSVVRWVAP
jgi:hypothetical protein